VSRERQRAVKMVEPDQSQYERIEMRDDGIAHTGSDTACDLVAPSTAGAQLCGLIVAPHEARGINEDNGPRVRLPQRSPAEQKLHIPDILNHR
jgi:hypothetical protein